MRRPRKEPFCATDDEEGKHVDDSIFILDACRRGLPTSRDKKAQSNRSLNTRHESIFGTRSMVRSATFLLLLLLRSQGVDAFFPSFRSSSQPAATKPNDSSRQASIRIRRTIESDLPFIAEMLASAVVAERDGATGWRSRMDQLFAKADIESLLRGRLCAMKEGAASWKRISNVYADESEENRLKIFWATSERLRNLIEKAAQETGEENLWQTHNFVLTPADRNWFNHLQITAEDTKTGKVVGFCEVAMLSNPSQYTTCRITSAVVDEENGKEKQFSPGITNLATSSEYRRKGIGTRLLRHTERFVAMHWKAERLGLFVEKTNAPAIGLYSKLGYQSEATCDGGDVLGDLWYMVKDLTVGHSQEAMAEARLAAFSDL